MTIFPVAAQLVAKLGLYKSTVRQFSAIILICLTVNLVAAQVYEVNWGKEKPILMTIAGIGSADIYLYNRLEGLTVEEINVLNREDIIGFDRFVTNKRSLSLDKLSDVTHLTAFTLPLISLLDNRIRQEAGAVVVMLVETMALNAVLTGLSKVSFRRNRPLIYNPQVPIEDKLAKNGRLSFFSGHTSNSATLSFFTAKIFNDIHPESPLKPFVWVGAAVLPAVVGYARVSAGKHFVSDVSVGYIVGAAIGCLIPALHKIKGDTVSLNIGDQGGLALRIMLDK